MCNSDVAITMRKEDFNNFSQRLKSLDKKDFSTAEYIHNDMQVKEVEGVMLIQWNWIRWNTCDTTISWIEGFLTELREKGHPYTQIIIGDDLNDNSEIIYCGECGEDDDCNIIELSRKVELIV